MKAKITLDALENTLRIHLSSESPLDRAAIKCINMQAPCCISTAERPSIGFDPSYPTATLVIRLEPKEG